MTERAQRVAYVAGPYRSARGVAGIYDNIAAARRVALELWQLGYVALCPHLNAAFFDGAFPDEVILRGDIELLRRCDLVVLVPGWQESAGTRDEVEEARTLGIPCYEWTLDADRLRADLHAVPRADHPFLEMVEGEGLDRAVDRIVYGAVMPTTPPPPYSTEPRVALWALEHVRAWPQLNSYTLASPEQGRTDAFRVVLSCGEYAVPLVAYGPTLPLAVCRGILLVDTLRQQRRGSLAAALLSISS
jgi:hypothetical protein